METNRVNFKIGGPAGSGVATVGMLFAKCMQRAGLFVFGTNDYPSLIKGGHNTYAVSAAPEPIHSLLGKLDILIALDRQTIEKHAGELAGYGTIIYDSGKITDAETAGARKDILFMGEPFSEIAARHGGEIMVNTVAFGAAAGIMQLDFAIVESLMQKIWGKKGKETVDANMAAAKEGYDNAKQKLTEPFRVKIEPLSDGKTMYINGNEASVAGAMRAGCKFVAEYPMSPSSSILHLMAGHENDYEILVKQTEDEICAANMIAGAAFAGVRCMTATSGGGFSLMAEALGLMGMSELPCVIFESQRCGPATALPTYTEQADLAFVIHAAQGEFPRVVVAPGDVTECFTEAVNAFNIAECLQTPVIVFLDKYLSESSCTVEDFRNIPVKVERGKLLSDEVVAATQGDFKRYAFSPDGISPRCIPGQKGGMHVCSSYEHDETGYTSEEPDNRVKMIDKRAKKLSMLFEPLILPTFYGAKESEAEMLLVCWGSTKGPMLEALKLLDADGIKARMMHIRYANPFPGRAVAGALTKAKSTVIFEGNSGAQMRWWIFQKTGYHIEKTYLRYDGRPFTPEEIANHVKKLLGRMTP